MPEISSEKYTVSYVQENAVVTCQGSLLLNGAPAYKPILDLLKAAAKEQENGQLSVDITQLKFMNSSAINMMTKFIMYVSDIEALSLDLHIKAHEKVAWQARLCFNLQRLMPDLKTDLEAS